SRTASGRESACTNVGSAAAATLAVVIYGYPIASSSDDSSGVPQTRQITDEQSPQVSGSSTGFAQCGQYKLTGCAFGSWDMIRSANLAQLRRRLSFWRC